MGDLVIELTKKVQNEPFGDAVVVEAVATNASTPATLISTTAAAAAAAAPESTSAFANRIDSSSDKHGIMKDIIDGQSTKVGGATDQTSDIMALLSKAQREYEGVGGIVSKDIQPGNQTDNDQNTNYDTTTNDVHHNNDAITNDGGPVSISVSSLFATANGRRLTQGDLSDDNHLIYDDNNNNDSNKKDSYRSKEPVKRLIEVVPTPDGRKVDSAEGNDDVLQSFVRKMNINGIQSLDPSAMGVHERAKASDHPLVPRPVSLAIAKIDVQAPSTTGENHHYSASVSSDGGVIPLMTDRRVAPDHESFEPRVKKGREKREPPRHSTPWADGSSSSVSAGGKKQHHHHHRNSVPSFSPPSCKRLPPIPAHFTSSIGSGLASSPNSGSSSDSGSSPTTSVFGSSHTREIPLLTPSAFEEDSYAAQRELGHLING